MAALTSLALAVGVGTMAYGTYNSYQGSQKSKAGAEQAARGSAMQAEAARQQAQISKEQAATSVVFAGKERDINLLASTQSIAASNQSFDINQGTIAAERAIEGQRKQAMELDARRQQLEVIRNQQRGRALALTTSTAQGASRGSGLQGGYGQIAGQTGVNLLGIQQNLQIGQNIFSQNEAISNNRVAQSELEHTYALQQAANQTAKANLTYSLAESNAAYTTRFADTQTLMSQGGGQVAMGQGQMQAGSAQSQFGSQLFNAGPSIFNMGTNANQLFGGNSGGGFGFGSPFMGGFSPTGYGTGKSIFG